MAYDANKDYTKAIQDAIASGASADVVNQLNNERNEKIAAAGGALDKYKDDTAQMVSEYTAGKTTGSNLANNYFPEKNNSGSVPRGYGTNTSVGSGTTVAPNGDVLAMHDWSTDTTDYSLQMQNAKTIEEFRKAAQAREHKANAQGIDISGASGAMSNEQIYNEWAKKNNYNPSYGDYLYGGYGKDWQGNETWIDNAGIGQGYYGMDASGNWGYYADPGLTQKLDNGNWARSSDGGPVVLDERGLPYMTKEGRDMSRAGQTVIMTGNGRDYFKVTYGENGYITRSVKLNTNHVDGLKLASAANNGAGVTSQELLKQQTGHTYVGPGSAITQADVRPGTTADYYAALAARDAAQGGQGGYYGADVSTPEGMNALLEQIRSEQNTNVSGGLPSNNSSSNNSPGNDSSFDSHLSRIDELEAQLLAWQKEANQAAVDLSVKEIEATLENGLAAYSKDAAEAYLKMLQAEHNQTLRNSAAGDLGGIGQKQYSAAESQYEAALLQIALEKEAFINSSKQQIDQLRAQGRFQEAQILSDWAQSKLDRYDNNYKWYQELLLKEKQIDYQQFAADREFAYNRAVDMLNRGILTGDALETLGISSADAQRYADMLNEEAQINLAYSKAQLDALVNENAGMSYSSSGSGPVGTPSYTPPSYTPPTPTPDTSNQPIGTVVVVGADGKTRTATVYSDGTIDGLQTGDSFTMDGETYTFDGSQIRNAKEAAGINTWLGNAKKALSITNNITPDGALTELQRRVTNLQNHIAETNAKLNQYRSYNFEERVKSSGLIQGERYLTGLSASEVAAYREWVSLTAELERYQRNLDTFNGLIRQYQQYR